MSERVLWALGYESAVAFFEPLLVAAGPANHDILSFVPLAELGPDTSPALCRLVALGFRMVGRRALDHQHYGLAIAQYREFVCEGETFPVSALRSAAPRTLFLFHATSSPGNPWLPGVDAFICHSERQAADTTIRMRELKGTLAQLDAARVSKEHIGLRDRKTVLVLPRPETDLDALARRLEQLAARGLRIVCKPHVEHSLPPTTSGVDFDVNASVVQLLAEADTVVCDGGRAMLEAIYLGKPLVIAREPKRVHPSVRDGRDPDIEAELGVHHWEDMDDLFGHLASSERWTRYFETQLPSLQSRLFPRASVAASGPFHVEPWVTRPVPREELYCLAEKELHHPLPRERPIVLALGTALDIVLDMVPTLSALAASYTVIVKPYFETDPTGEATRLLRSAGCFVVEQRHYAANPNTLRFLAQYTLANPLGSSLSTALMCGMRAIAVVTRRRLGRDAEPVPASQWLRDHSFDHLPIDQVGPIYSYDETEAIVGRLACDEYWARYDTEVHAWARETLGRFTVVGAASRTLTLLNRYLHTGSFGDDELGPGPILEQGGIERA